MTLLRQALKEIRHDQEKLPRCWWCCTGSISTCWCVRPAVHYGTITLAELEEVARQEAVARGWRALCFQTNHEGEFVELVQRFRTADAFLVNPGRLDTLQLCHP